MKYTIAKSDIQGKGLFAKQGYKKGEIIGLSHVDNKPTSTIGKYHNHSDKPTAVNIKKGNQRFLIANMDIPAGVEITTNYRRQPELEQPEDFKQEEYNYVDDLTPEQIQEYARGGYIIEDVSIPSLNQKAKGGALLTKKVTCKECGWTWDAADGGNDMTTCHKCGGQGLVHAQEGGEPKRKKERFVEGTYDPNETAGYELTEKEVLYKQTASNWGKAAIAYEKRNPEEKFIEKKKRQYIKAHPSINKLFGTKTSYGLASDPNNYAFTKEVEDNFKREYEYKKNTAVVKKVGRQEGWNPNKRNQYVDDLNDTQRGIVAESKFGNKLQAGYWNRALAGVQELGNTLLPGQPFKYNIPGLTKNEQKEIRNDSTGAVEIFAPMDIPGLWVANALKNRGLTTGSNYKDLPSWYSGEKMANVDDTEAMAFSPLTYYGLEALPKAIASGIKAGYKGLKASKEAGLLSNTYKLNPWANKLDDYNRVVGQDAILDLQNSGLVRAGEKGGVETNMVIRTSAYPSFGKGLPGKRYIDQTIQQGKNPYIISTNRPMSVSTLGRHGKGSTMFPVDETGKYMSAFSADEAKVFDAKPHWLKGYKEVPKELPGSPNTAFFNDLPNSEIPQINPRTGLLQVNNTTMLNSTLPRKFVETYIPDFKSAEGLSEDMMPYLLPKEELMKRYPFDYMSKDELIGQSFKSGLRKVEFPEEIPASFNTQEDIWARALGKPLPKRVSRASQEPKIYYDLDGNMLDEPLKSGFDGNLITRPLTPFTKNELTTVPGKNMGYGFLDYKEDGGQIIMNDLSDAELKQYIQGGYIIEKI
jgi:predicted Zn-ribbon and HTH transcriptional regulator